MPRNITVTFSDGTTHVYQNAPDNISPEQVSARAQKDFGKQVKALDGGRGSKPKPMSAGEKRATELKAKKDKVRGEAGFGDLLTQGFTFGLSDEASGVGNAINNAITAPFSRDVDFDPVGSYKAGVKSERMRLDDARRRTGGLGTATEIAGGLMGGGLATKAPKAVMTLREMFRGGAKAGAVSGGISGAGYGEGVEGKTGGARTGTVMGGVIGGTLGAAFAPRAPKLVRPEGTAVVAKRLNVRPTPATTGGPAAQAVQMGLGNMPGSSGPVAKAVVREAEAASACWVDDRSG